MQAKSTSTLENFEEKAKPRDRVMLTPEQDYDYQERAALMEFDGGLSRADAEREARRLVLGERAVPEQPDLFRTGRVAVDELGRRRG